MVGQSSVMRVTNSSREMKPVRKESSFHGEGEVFEKRFGEQICDFKIIPISLN